MRFKLSKHLTTLPLISQLIFTGPDYGSGDVSSLDERHVKSDYSKDDYNVELGSGSLDQALKLEQLNRQEQITIGYDSRTVSESEPERGNEIKSKNDNQTLLYPPHKNQNTVSVPKNIRDPLASLDKGVGSNHSSANSSHSHNILGNMSRSNGTSGDATEGSSGDGEVTSASGDELLSSIQKETQDLLTEFRENVYSRSENKSVNETASTSLSPEDEGQKRDGGIKIEESMLNDQEAVSQKQSVSLTETENKGFPSDFNDTFGIMNVEEDVNPSNTSSSRNGK